MHEVMVDCLLSSTKPKGRQQSSNSPIKLSKLAADQSNLNVQKADSEEGTGREGEKEKERGRDLYMEGRQTGGREREMDR